MSRIESNIKRYLAGILFIMLSLVIISATTYVASVIPASSFPPTPPLPPPPSDPFNGTTPTNVVPREFDNITLNNTNTIIIRLTQAVLATATIYVILDLNTLNGANVSSFYSYDSNTWNPASGNTISVIIT